jgi:hypothetical protein
MIQMTAAPAVTTLDGMNTDMDRGIDAGFARGGTKGIEDRGADCGS